MRKDKHPEKERPICGCRHDLAFHEPDGDGGGSKCHALMTGTAIQFNDYDEPTAWAQVPCTCQQYTGPRLIDPGYMARAMPVDPR